MSGVIKTRVNPKVGDTWRTKVNPIDCVVTSVEADDCIMWVTSYAAADGSTDASTLFDFFDDYEFVSSPCPVAAGAPPNAQSSVRNIDKAVTMFNTLTGHQLTAAQATDLIQLLKIVGVIATDK